MTDIKWAYFGYNNNYRVSSCGSIIQTREGIGRKNGKDRTTEWRKKTISFRRTDYTGAGYLGCSYKRADGISRSAWVHRIVATAFCKNPDNLPEVDHIDGNRFNNNPSNLRWVSRKQNAANAKSKGAFDYNGSFKGKIKMDDVFKIKKLLEEGVKRKEIAKLYNVDLSVICRLANKKAYKKAWEVKG